MHSCLFLADFRSFSRECAQINENQREKVSNGAHPDEPPLTVCAVAAREGVSVTDIADLRSYLFFRVCATDVLADTRAKICAIMPFLADFR